LKRTVSPSPRIVLAVLSLGGISYALLQSLVVPALPQIQSSLHVSESAVGWVLTAFLLSASVATPIIGRLGDMYGKERLLIIVLLMLALGTLISAVASSLWLMILGRVIQGAQRGRVLAAGQQQAALVPRVADLLQQLPIALVPRTQPPQRLACF